MRFPSPQIVGKQTGPSLPLFTLTPAWQLTNNKSDGAKCFATSSIELLPVNNDCQCITKHLLTISQRGKHSWHTNPLFIR